MTTERPRGGDGVGTGAAEAAEEGAEGARACESRSDTCSPASQTSLQGSPATATTGQKPLVDVTTTGSGRGEWGVA